VSAVVRTEVDDGVAVVVVDSPPVNSLSNEVLEELERAAIALRDDVGVRAIILTGTGDKAFLAGADLEELGQALGQRKWIEHHTSLTRRTLGLWEELSQPVIAAVQASALGGGLEFALVCDLIVADPRAKLGSPEVTLGLIPGGGATQRLPQRVPPAVAKELLSSRRAHRRPGSAAPRTHQQSVHARQDARRVTRARASACNAASDRRAWHQAGDERVATGSARRGPRPGAATLLRVLLVERRPRRSGRIPAET
jgi:hypothetical protein